MKNINIYINEKLRIRKNDNIINNAEDIANAIEEYFLYNDKYTIEIVDKHEKILKWKYNQHSSTYHNINTFYYVDFYKNDRVMDRIRIGLNDYTGGFLIQLLRNTNSHARSNFVECQLLGFHKDSELNKGMTFIEWLEKIKNNTKRKSPQGDINIISLFGLE